MLNEMTIERVTGALVRSGELQYTETLVESLTEDQYVDFIQQIDQMVLYEESITQELLTRIFKVIGQTVNEDMIANLLRD